MTGNATLEVRNLGKEYPGTRALDDLSLDFRAGTVHAVVGRNGAGKSTLVKILSGAVRPTSGSVRLDGRPVAFASPAAALAHGIATVYQELSLVPGLSVAENILLGRWPARRRFPVRTIDWAAVRSRAGAILDELGIEVDPGATASELDVAHQQVVEIAKAMSFRPRVLLLDEPTSALTHQGAEHLFRVVRELRTRNVVIIYVTHRLQELALIADHVSVLRDGRLVGTLPVAAASGPTLARMMFGEDVNHLAPTPRAPSGKAVLEVHGMKPRGASHAVGFSVESGEVLGLAGTLGSGRTELLRAVFGADPIEAGEVRVRGRAVGRPDPHGMKSLGVGLVPENRKEEGLVGGLSVSVNLCLACPERISSSGVLSRRKEHEIVAGAIDRLGIVVSMPDQPVAALSGGNQQKVVIGKWINTQPAVLFFDEPTRGIDIRAKQQVFDVIRSLAGQGVACVFVSTELEELLEVCHRILVLRKGRIKTELRVEGLTLERLFTECIEE